jgi:hypothetical protein
VTFGLAEDWNTAGRLAAGGDEGAVARPGGEAAVAVAVRRQLAAQVEQGPVGRRDVGEPHGVVEAEPGADLSGGTGDGGRHHVGQVGDTGARQLVDPPQAGPQQQRAGRRLVEGRGLPEVEPAAGGQVLGVGVGVAVPRPEQPRRAVLRRRHARHRHVLAAQPAGPRVGGGPERAEHQAVADVRPHLQLGDAPALGQRVDLDVDHLADAGLGDELGDDPERVAPGRRLHRHDRGGRPGAAVEHAVVAAEAGRQLEAAAARRRADGVRDQHGVGRVGVGRRGVHPGSLAHLGGHLGHGAQPTTVAGDSDAASTKLTCGASARTNMQGGDITPIA